MKPPSKGACFFWMALCWSMLAANVVLAIVLKRPSFLAMPGSIWLFSGLVWTGNWRRA